MRNLSTSSASCAAPCQLRPISYLRFRSAFSNASKTGRSSHPSRICRRTCWQHRGRTETVAVAAAPPIKQERVPDHQKPATLESHSGAPGKRVVIVGGGWAGKPLPFVQSPT